MVAIAASEILGVDPAPKVRESRPVDEAKKQQLSLLGGRIVERRLAKGWTREKLSVEANVPYPSLVTYEAGAREPGVLALHLLAKALACCMDELVTGENCPASTVPATATKKPAKRST